MATQPTNLPVPSESARDLKFNAGKIDEFVTSSGWTYTDRFGNKHYTIEGINYLAQQVMNSFGYITLTGVSFTTGATITKPNEVLFNETNNEYYKWTGSFASGPKVVPANSTPESTGGIGAGAWLGVGDSTTRQWTGDNFRLTGYSKLQNQTFQSGSAFSSSKQVLFDEASGLYWMWTGALPKTVNAGDDPKSDPSYYAVGLLNGKDISDLSGWCDTVSNVDVTSQMQQYFRTLAYLKMPAICYGSVKVSSQIICFDVPYDMSKLVVTLDLAAVDSTITNNGSVFKTTEPDEQVITGFTTDLTAINQDTSSVLLQFGDCTFSYTSTESAYLRNNGKIVPKTDTLLCTATDRSIFRSTPSLYSLSSNVDVSVKPIKNLIRIALPTIQLIGQYPDGSSKIERVIEVRRNRVSIYGGNLKSLSGSNNRVNTFLYIHQCALIDIECINMEGSSTDYEYAINMFSTAFVSVRRCTFLRGWGFIDGNFMRDTIIEKCIIAGLFGSHAMQWNLTVRDCNIYAFALPNASTQAGGVNVTGGGELLVENCEYWFNGGNHAAEHIVGCRQDYGQGWEGDITVRNIKVYFNKPGATFTIVYLAGAYPNTMDYTRPYSYYGKKIIVEDVVVYPTTDNIAPANVIIQPVGFAAPANQSMKIRLADEVIIRRISSDKERIGGLRMLVGVPGVKNDPARYAQKSVNFKVHECDFTTGGVVFSLAEPGSEGSVISNNVLFEDCYGEISGLLTGTNKDRWDFRNCTIGSLGSSGSLNAIKVFLYNCTINGAKCGGNSTSEQWNYYGNRVTLAGTVSLGSRAIFCQGNSVNAGSSITGRTYDEFWSYRDSSIFKVA